MNAQIEIFQKYREELHGHFSRCSDALFNVLDSISGRQTAQSGAELSLEIPFERRYSSLYRAVDKFFHGTSSERQRKGLERAGILAPVLPNPERYPFHIIGIDATPAPRPYAKTLPDRGIVHCPNPAPGNKPIGVGHSYSVTALLPERESGTPPWVVPLICTRIPTSETAIEVGVKQLKGLLESKDLPFHEQLTVNVADAGYSTARYLSVIGAYGNNVVVARLAGNRKLYRMISDAPGRSGRGHPKWFGEVFDLKDETTWGKPDEEVITEIITRKGTVLQVKIERWNNLLMRGKKDAPMHNRPFDLVRCRVFNDKGELVFKRPLWLTVLGSRRGEISTEHVYEAYRRRYDLEHFFRFGKNKLLLDRFRTSTVEHEENWWELCCLAYTHLWLAASLSEKIPRPWEKYKPEFRNRTIPGPAQVQRDFVRIIRAIGTPAVSPKPRGNSPGRKKGHLQARRIPRTVIYKRAFTT